jgi:hypothetical protein
VGVNHIRISYANSRENLTEALSRIRRFVEPLVAAGAVATGSAAGSTSAPTAG